VAVAKEAELTAVAMADGALQRRLWRALERVAAVLGPRPARAVAAGAMRLAARTERGYAKGLYRVASRRPVPMPDLWTVPEAWWSTAPRVSPRRLGLRLHLDLRDNLQRTLYFCGTYEPGLLRLLEDELRAGDTVLDVGAHVGVHALIAARRLRALGGGRVIAFEPTPDSAAAARAAAARNGLPVEVVESGLGEADGEIELRGDPRYPTHDAGVRSQFGEGDVVARAPVTTFDAWAQRAGLDRLDVVKVDIEGAEILALRGMRSTLRALKPRLLAIEVKDVVMERGPGDEAVLHALLAECGYAPAGSPERHVAVFRPGSARGGRAEGP
jgi:FkbM family methyltransferase